MPPKKNVTKKNIVKQKQKQKKAKQQQQQQQGQNVNIKIDLSKKTAPRKERVPRAERVPVQQQLPIPQAQYVPMHIIQQPATYFSPPVSTTSTIPNTTFTQPMQPSQPTIGRSVYAPSVELDTFYNTAPRRNIINDFVGNYDLDEPFGIQFPTQNSLSKAIDNAGTQTERRYFNPADDVGTQTETQFEAFENPIINTPISVAISQMETHQPQQKRIPAPPPLPPPRLPLTRENLSMFSDTASEYSSEIGGSEIAPTEISDLTTITGRTGATSNIFEQMMQRANQISEKRNFPIEEAILGKKEEKPDRPNLFREISSQAQRRQEKNVDVEEQLKAGEKERTRLREERIKQEQGDIKSSMIEQMEKRRQFIQAPAEEEDENNDWEEDFSRAIVPPKPLMIPPPPKEEPEKEEDFTPKKKSAIEEEVEEEIIPRKPVQQENKLRKPGSGRPKGSGNISGQEKLYKQQLANEREIKKDYKERIDDLRNGDYPTDEDYMEGLRQIEEYERLLEETKQNIKELNALIELEKTKRIKKGDSEIGTIGEEDEEEF